MDVAPRLPYHSVCRRLGRQAHPRGLQHRSRGRTPPALGSTGTPSASTSSPTNTTTTTTTATSGGVKLRSKSGRTILSIEVRALPCLAGVGSLPCSVATRCRGSRNTPGGEEESGEVLVLLQTAVPCRRRAES